MSTSDALRAQLLLAQARAQVAEAQRDTLAEALAERDERLHRIHMFFENLSLRGILNIATEDALAGVASPEEQP